MLFAHTAERGGSGRIGGLAHPAEEFPDGGRLLLELLKGGLRHGVTDLLGLRRTREALELLDESPECQRLLTRFRLLVVKADQ